MLKEQIQELKNCATKPREELSIQLLFETIITHFKSNIEILEAFSNKTYGEQFDMQKVNEIFTLDRKNIYGNVSNPRITEYAKVSENLVPYGVVGLSTLPFKINIYSYLEIIKVCLETKNSLVIFENKKNEFLEAVVVLINDILVQTPDFAKILITNESLKLDLIDVLIVFGGKKIARTFQNNNIPVISVGGSCDLCFDDIKNEKLVYEANKNNAKIYSVNDKDFYEKLNSESDNYASSIFSTNPEKIREFVINCKSSYVLVNMSPLNMVKINLNPEQLLKRKITIIYDGK